MRKKYVCEHIGYFSSNAARLEQFYTEKLGFIKVKETIISQSVIETLFSVSSECKMVKLDAGEVYLEIFEPFSDNKKDKKRFKPGCIHWAISVDNYDEFVEYMKKEDVPLISVYHNGHWIYFILDPDGNRIEVRQKK